MSHLSNPLATAQQLYSRTADNALPTELQDTIRYFTARLTQAAGVLLRLPQSVAAQAVVILYRYWVVEDLMRYEFSDVSAASIYLTAKVSSSPRSLRSITNVYAYLLSPSSPLFSNMADTMSSKPDPESYYLSESSYITFRNRLLSIEGQILNATSFNVHVALPHPLAITYLQALDLFSATHPSGTGARVATRAVQYLNTALLSPQMMYLTHQPSALATAAIYLASRETDVKLPEGSWWEVFDCEREELGFLCLGMGSLEPWVMTLAEKWGGCMITRSEVRMELSKLGAEGDLDEEAEMMRLLDEKVGV